MLLKEFLFSLNAAFAMAVLDLIPQVHLPSSVYRLRKYFKHLIFSSCFWFIIIVTVNGCLEILTNLAFST